MREDCLRNTPGNNDIQKLQAWGEAEGLFIDFDVEVGGFTSEIRTLTFQSGRQAVRDAGIGPPEATEQRTSRDISEVVEDPDADGDAEEVDAVSTEAALSR